MTKTQNVVRQRVSKASREYLSKRKDLAHLYHGEKTLLLEAEQGPDKILESLPAQLALAR